MKTETKTLGNWQIIVSDQRVLITQEEIEHLRGLAIKWVGCFPKEETFASQRLGTPSTIIRFDYVVKDGVVTVFEIEDRPAGLAVGSTVSVNFCTSLASFWKELEENVDRPVGIFVSKQRLGNCDDLLVPSLIPNIEVFQEGAQIPTESLLLVRCNRDELHLKDLVTRSISTVSEEGWKGYGKDLGLWKTYDGRLDFDGPVVLKPEYGCRSEGVVIFDPNKRRSGFDTLSKLKRITEGATYYEQPFVEPETNSWLLPGYAMIRRLFFTTLNGLDFRPIGGCWVARKSVKIHGASDSISGELVLS